MIPISDELLARFEAKIEKGDGCWLWKASLDAHGYGQFQVGVHVRGKSWMVKAHRLAYFLYVGAIDASLSIDHLCRNPACVNPSHMELVTRGENVLRGVGFAALNRRKTHCRNGHEYTTETTRRTSKGWRVCRPCSAAWKRKSYALRKEISQ